MTPTANLASMADDADHPAAPAAEAGSFVLNLCSSTTPMALAQTDLPELKRFTFFVSRRFEEGRERFRLHMGFFASQEEAEEWLGVVRDIYPGAWAGEAPGKKLRARATEAAAAQAQHAVGPQSSPTAPPPPAARPTPPASSPATQQSKQPAASAQIPTLVPTLHPPAAAPAVAKASAPRAASAQAAKPAPQLPAKRPQAPAPTPRAGVPAAARVPAQNPPAPRAASVARPAASPAPSQPRPGSAPAANQRPVTKPVQAAKPAVPSAPTAQARPVAQPRPVVQARPAAQQARPTSQAKPAASAAAKSAPQPAPRAVQQPVKKVVFADSNVKEVLAALDSHGDPTGETRVMQVPVGRGDTADDSSLTDTQVLRFLETRREEDAVQAPSPLQADSAAESGISLLKPDDTGTRRALKEAVSHNDPVSFAVQLQWSVQPVALDKVPPLAIFSAYTLYSVEGSREGRKWYGLRLGFFNDAISAKQVAYYVRSEFNSVAVVPVSPQERERATEDNQRFAGGAMPRKRRANEDNEFKLIDSDQTEPAGAAAAASPQPAPAEAAAPAASKPAADTRGARKSVGKSESAGKTESKGGGKVEARERRTPQTLEETLEILGANELAIDNNSGSVSDTGVRHLRVEIQKNTPFSRLLERLSERVKKA
jgi:hypothetical protein